MKRLLPALLLILALAGTARADEWDTFYAPVYEGYDTYVLVMNYSDHEVDPEFEVMLDGRVYDHYLSLRTRPRSALARRIE
jgi:hypothetical protein